MFSIPLSPIVVYILITPTSQSDPMKLPKSVQPIADVIGITQTLRLIGQLPVCQVRDKRYGAAISNRIILIVPVRLKPDDKLVQMVGYDDARKLVAHFGGEYLYPATCAEIYRDFLKKSAHRMLATGMKPTEIAEAMLIPYRTISRWLKADAIPTHDAHQSPVKILTATGENVESRRNVAN